jgi:hypothetical protein
MIETFLSMVTQVDWGVYAFQAIFTAIPVALGFGLYSLIATLFEEVAVRIQAIFIRRKMKKMVEALQAQMAVAGEGVELDADAQSTAELLATAFGDEGLDDD